MENSNKNDSCRIKTPEPGFQFPLFSPALFPPFPPARRPACKGFSLIELLVCLALVSTLAFQFLKFSSKTGEPGLSGKTRIRMVEIREAVTGRAGAYCNGNRQEVGFVSHIGFFPPFEDVLGTPDNVADDQPKKLWEQGGLPAWHSVDLDSRARLWAGWRGPYVESPSDGVLRDGWGSPFRFEPPDVVLSGGAIYLCVRNHHKGVNLEPYGWDVDDCEPGVGARYRLYWLELEGEKGAKYLKWAEPWRPDRTYSGAFNIISNGPDGRPDTQEETESKTGDDLTLKINYIECMAPVEGRFAWVRGNASKPYVEACLYYPDKGQIQHEIVCDISNNGVYFTGTNISGSSVEGYAFSGKAVYSRFVEDACMDVPIGLRYFSVRGADVACKVFCVVPAENFIGTLVLN